MGHQATLFITPKDTGVVEDALPWIDDFVILHSRSATAKSSQVEHLNFEEDDKPWLYLLLVLREHVNEVVTTHVSKQGYWTVDSLRSPVIELARSFFDGHIIRRGRLYYVDGFYGANDEWIEKPAAFRSWAAKALRTLKKTLTRRGTAYVGAEAGAWLDSGGKVDPPDDAAFLRKA